MSETSKPLEIARVTRVVASLRGRAARGVAIVMSAMAIGLAAGVLLFSPDVAQAKDDRPSEIPYDTTDGIPALDPSYRHTEHKVVIITDHDLKPRLVTIEEGQLVAWISYARSPSTIVFEREVAKSMICHSLINFTIKDDELKSADIHNGEFASFCQLKPGRYTYKVVRRDPKLGGASGGRRVLEGEIIVGNPD